MSNQHDKSVRPAPRQDEPEESLIANVDEPGPAPAWVAQLHQQVLAEVHDRRRKMPHPLGWRRIGNWAASGAAVAGVAMTLVLLWTLSRSEVSFAAVQERIREAATVRFVTRVELIVDGGAQHLIQTHSWADQARGARTDLTLLGQPVLQLLLPRRGEPMVVMHPRQEVMPLQLPDDLGYEVLQRLEPTALARELGEQIRRATPLGRRNRGDVEQVGFHIDGKDLSVRAPGYIEVWVDPDTQLPVQVVGHVPLNNDRSLRWTVDNIHWHEPFDDDVVGAAVPAHYETLAPLVVPPPGEAALLRALRSIAELNHGRFPTDAMVSWQAIGYAAALLRFAASDDGTLPRQLHGSHAQRQLIGDLLAGAAFYLQLRDQNANPRYLGSGTRLGEAGQVLLTWRQSDGRKRVIDASLEAETQP